MKGIAHFSAGVAVASCLPGVVAAAAEGRPLYFILAGIFGLLPDTIDFRFARFFARHECEVVPDPNRPDPCMIADGIAMAVNRAAETGKPFNVKLRTVRIGADLWQQFTVTFDTAARRVEVAYGPVVDTGGNPVEGVGQETGGLTASAPLLCPIQLDYLAATRVDIFDGPLFCMEPQPDGSVVPRFIPWHREWSHSFPMALLCALAAGLLWDLLAAAVVFAAWSAHILVDQTGFMGSRLFFPFGKARTPGLKWTHSGDALPNFGIVWFCCLLIFWNLSRPVIGVPVVSLYTARMFIYGLLLPGAILLAVRRWVSRDRAVPQ